MNDSIGNEKTISPGSPSGGHAYALKPGDTLGQYKVIKPLGAGGMGEVYEVEHLVLGRRYALKLLPATLDWMGVSLERFRREAKVMANLDHPNILKVDEFGETDGRYWLRMELIDGIQIEQKQTKETKKGKIVSLQDLSDAHGGKIPQEELLPILKQILEGLDYAHKRGAIHRDLKPSNILLSPPPPNTQHPIPNTHYPTPKIADFGLVKLVGEDWVRSQAQLSVQRSMAGSISDAKTQHQIPNTKYPTPNAQNPEGTSTRALLGTFEYMSPEQKRGEEADARSDLYAVGLIAYRLLTGRSNVLKLPSRIDTTLASGWDDFVEQALEEDKEDRLSGADQGLRLLGEIEGDLAKRGQTEREKAAAEDRRLAREELARREAAAKERRAAEDAAEAARRKAEEQRLAEELRLAEEATNVARQKEAKAEQYFEEQRDPSAGNVLRMAFVKVAAGSFDMGSNSGNSNEKPVRTVRITRDFWMGKYEVTQRQYRDLMDSNPSHFKGDDLPVECVSWHDAVKFCEEFTKRELAAGRLQLGLVYRLPTEAEWEYAARGGDKSKGYAYSGGNNLDAVGWWSGILCGNSENKTQRVGRKHANELGLHDMSGNVWEWVHDWYQGNYNRLPTTDPTGPANGTDRVIRGGAWPHDASNCLVTNRNYRTPVGTTAVLGFRVALAAPVQ